MPQRKRGVRGDIDEAMQLLASLGYDVSPPIPPGEEREAPIKRSSPVIKKVGKNLTITLRKAHSISYQLPGSENESSKFVNKTYGPGAVTVPRKLAGDLLYRDQAAMRVEERFNDVSERCYMIKEQRTTNGMRINAGRRVRDSFFNDPNVDIEREGYLYGSV